MKVIIILSLHQRFFRPSLVVMERCLTFLTLEVPGDPYPCKTFLAIPFNRHAPVQVWSKFDYECGRSSKLSERKKEKKKERKKKGKKERNRKKVISNLRTRHARARAMVGRIIWTPPPVDRHSTKIIFHIHVTFDLWWLYINVDLWYCLISILIKINSCFINHLLADM